ncbi:protease adaptor protein RcdA [Roseibium sp. LAB1]
MTDDIKKAGDTGSAVHIAHHLASSDSFQNLFQEGMSLVEETAMYLDGSGRDEAKQLPRPASLAYATESMRLTTRLMQLASWLLLQRAVNEGEMSREQAGSEKNKVRLDKLSTASGGPTWSDLPETLRELIERSSRLQERVVHLDKMLYRKDAEPVEEATNDNPVASQINKLHAAFGKFG